MAEGHSHEVASLEEVIQKKSREIYDLTVKLGALKEENYQVKRDLEELKG
jgi:regulator of replication initiation timing